jgi:hypothetical protein
MHEILEVVGHVMRFGVSVAALACGVAAVARFSFHPKSLPLGIGFAALGFGDFVVLALRVFGGWDLPGMRFVIPVFFVLASLAVLAGIKLIADCYAEGANAK